MRARFGDRVYGKYGFADAFNPTTGWVNPDVIGIDVGITLLSAENLRTGRIWSWFMANREVTTAVDRVGLERIAVRRPARSVDRAPSPGRTAAVSWPRQRPRSHRPNCLPRLAALRVRRAGAVRRA